MRVRVDDRGAGVPDGRAGELFEPFFTTKPDGTGLGLAISRAIARAHGGDVAYARDGERDALRADAAARRGAARARRRRGRRARMTGAGAASSRTSRACARGSCDAVERARPASRSPAAGLAEARARRWRREPIDCVLLDIRLRDGDGLDFLRELRAGPRATCR